MNLPTTSAIARQLGVSIDDASVLALACTDVLLAAAEGRIDLNAMARAELANRGMGADGRWIGFPQAEAVWGGSKAA